MSDYKAPLTEIAFVLEEHVGMAGIAALPGFEETTSDVVQAVLGGVAKLSEELIAPLNWPGDRQGTRVEKRGVVQADGFKEAYWQYVDGGWNSRFPPGSAARACRWCSPPRCSRWSSQPASPSACARC